MFVAEVIGNLGNNAEIKSDNGRKYAQFSVAHTVKFQKGDGSTSESTTWVSCFMSNVESEVIKYLVKGQRVFVRGNADPRLYSSEKDRKLKAGISINVREVELVGGTPEAVPRELYTTDGELIRVNKYYWVDLSHLGDKQPTELFDKRGNPYVVEQGHWVAPMAQPTSQETEQETVQSTENTTGQGDSNEKQNENQPFGEENPEQQKLANSK